MNSILLHLVFFGNSIVLGFLVIENRKNKHIWIIARNKYKDRIFL